MIWREKTNLFGYDSDNLKMIIFSELWESLINYNFAHNSDFFLNIMPFRILKMSEFNFLITVTQTFL